MEQVEYTPEQVQFFTEQAFKLKTELERRILGKHYPGFECDCDCIKKGEAIAIEVAFPHNPKYPDWKAEWFSWEVRLEEIFPSTTPHYWTGISAFLDETELDHLFRQYFGDMIPQQ